MRADTIVLGAGIVGVSVAVHLQKRGRAVVLVDRRGPGRGDLLRQCRADPERRRSTLRFPARFRRAVPLRAEHDDRCLLSPLGAAGDRAVPLAVLAAVAAAPRTREIARLYATLIERWVEEHKALAAEAGAIDLMRDKGWLKVFRTERERDRQVAEAEALNAISASNARGRSTRRRSATWSRTSRPSSSARLHWTAADLGDRSARAGRRLCGAVRTPRRADRAGQRQEPGRIGERLARGDATTAPIEARAAVIALGAMGGLADAQPRLRSAARGEARLSHALPRRPATRVLNHPVLDAERGYFSRRCEGHPPDDRARSSRCATRPRRRCSSRAPSRSRASSSRWRSGVDAEPWMGARPCTPDMMPIIGPAPRHKNLWFAFGHAHHGLTLGPVTGRLIAEMITGETPSIDPTPYRADRF